MPTIRSVARVRRAASAALLLLYACAANSAGSGAAWVPTTLDAQVQDGYVVVANPSQYVLSVQVYPSGLEGSPLVAIVPAKARVKVAEVSHAGLVSACPGRCAAWPGAIDAERQDDRLYSLPFQHGRTFRVSQVHGGELSTHATDGHQHAIDFEMPEGTPVHAARGGVVLDVMEKHFGEGRLDDSMRDLANYVVVQHADGTLGMYAHLQHDGAAVEPGQRVEEGELLGYSGNTGYSSGPHLHFAVLAPRTQENGRIANVSLPIRFRTGSNDTSEPLQQNWAVTAWFDGSVSAETGLMVAGQEALPAAADEAEAVTAAGSLSGPAVGAPGEFSAPRSLVAQDAPGSEGKLATIAALLLAWRVSRKARGA